MTRAARLPALTRRERDAIGEMIGEPPGHDGYVQPWETYRLDVETLDQLRRLLFPREPRT